MGITGKRSMFVIINVEHEIEIFIATLEIYAAFPLTYSFAPSREAPVSLRLSHTL